MGSGGAEHASAPAFSPLSGVPPGLPLWVPYHELCCFVQPRPLCARVLLAGVDGTAAVLRPASQVGYSGAWPGPRRGWCQAGWSLSALGPLAVLDSCDEFSVLLSLQTLAGTRPEGPEVSGGNLRWATWKSGVGSGQGGGSRKAPSARRGQGGGEGIRVLRRWLRSGGPGAKGVWVRLLLQALLQSLARISPHRPVALFNRTGGTGAAVQVWGPSWDPDTKDDLISTAARCSQAPESVPYSLRELGIV